VLFALAIGCSEKKENLKAFLATEIHRWGGRTNGLAINGSISTKWIEHRNNLGTVVDASTLSLSTIDEFFSTAFGEALTYRAPGVRYYDVTNAGVTIYLESLERGTRITILKDLDLDPHHAK
jgi:hypothetical protein